jgi:hypothetical protein
VRNRDKCMKTPQYTLISSDMSTNFIRRSRQTNQQKLMMGNHRPKSAKNAGILLCRPHSPPMQIAGTYTLIARSGGACMQR